VDDPEPGKLDVDRGFPKRPELLADGLFVAGDPLASAEDNVPASARGVWSVATEEMDSLPGVIPRGVCSVATEEMDCVESLPPTLGKLSSLAKLSEALPKLSESSEKPQGLLDEVPGNCLLRSCSGMSFIIGRWNPAALSCEFRSGMG